jgi:hypothetical protein
VRNPALVVAAEQRHGDQDEDEEQDKRDHEPQTEDIADDLSSYEVE